MRIEKISSSGTIAIRSVDINCNTPITLICAHNRGGKTSLRDAAQEQEFIEARMRVAPEAAQGVPLNCESKIGRNYGQMYASADLVV